MKPVSRQITVCGEGSAQRLAGVVIAGNDEDRHRKWRQQRSQMLVFGGFAVIDEVAGDDRDIGQRVEPVDFGDRTPGIRRYRTGGRAARPALGWADPTAG